MVRVQQSSSGKWVSHTLRALAMVALMAPLAGCLGYDGDIQHGYQLDEHALEQVKIGSSAEQVLVVLGTPSTTSTVGGDAWYYISQKTERMFAFQSPKITEQHILTVYFDQKKKVVRLANYGLQDGQVFDFISRTTPTGGKEQSYLANALSNLMRF